MKTILKMALVAIVLITSLTTYANVKPIDPNKKLVTVHIYRPAEFIGSAWNFNLKVNGEKYDVIKNGNHLVLTLEPGKTNFSIRKSSVDLDLEAGQTYYLRSFIKAGFLIGRLDLVEVTEDFAQSEMIKE